MKRFLLLFMILIYTISPAQISDSDAKLKYQQAETLYNEGDYFNASTQMSELTKSMGWNPKILYLYLKSVYQNYTAGSNQKSQRSYNKTYDNFKRFYEDCNGFLYTVDKNTYPKEKYQEIEDIQKYFKNKMDEYASQKDRTPKDAIDFLNECAKRFPGGYIKSSYNVEKYTLRTETLSFELTNHFLKVIAEENKLPKKGYDSKSIDLRIDIYDLSEGNIEYKNLFLLITPYYSYRQYYTIYDYYSNRKRDKEQRERTEDRIQKKKNFIPSDANLTEALSEKKGSEHYGWKKIDRMHAGANFDGSSYGSDFNFYDYFLRYSDSNQADWEKGNYEERIREALRFLIDSVPKKKAEEKEQIKTKF